MEKNQIRSMLRQVDRDLDRIVDFVKINLIDKKFDLEPAKQVLRDIQRIRESIDVDI